MTSCSSSGVEWIQPSGSAAALVSEYFYGRYYRSAMYPLLRRVSIYLRRWAGKKYKRLRTYKRFKRWWAGLLERQPRLFAHWQWVRSP